MQQRRLRLGDILDDYCPRERRITNHAVVAMIEDEVKQTRCTTCDADHPYKQGKAPAPRRKKSEGALFTDGLEHARPRVLPTNHSDPVALADESDESAPIDSFEPDALEPDALEPELDTVLEAAPVSDISDSHADDDQATGDDIETGSGVEDEWPVHRRLIRATLPRPEGQVPERKEPDFTMRRPMGRGADGNRNGHRHRGNGGNQRPMRQAQGQGHSGNGQTRFGGPRHEGNQHRGQGHGQQGNRGGRPGGQGRNPQQSGGQGRKRGR